MLYGQVHLSLPAWIHQEVDRDKIYDSDASKIALAIELSQLNVDRRTGGPFGAAVFSSEGRLVGVGVNRVVAHTCSHAHAEILALATSQQRTQQFRLNQSGSQMVLATSAQPCAMCFGALIWAGIDLLLVGARAEDVTSLTQFDEGPIPENWVAELRQRGIEVKTDLMRDEACAVLRKYAEDGLIY